MTNSEKVLEKLIEKKWHISFAESMTGGLLAASLIQIPNASKVIEESFVTYSINAKNKYLNIELNDESPYTVVSSEVSELMANNLQLKTKTEVAVSITGNAGPGFDYKTNKLEAYITIKILDELYTYSLKFNPEKTRKQNIGQTVSFVYRTLFRLIK